MGRTSAGAESEPAGAALATLAWCVETAAGSVAYADARYVERTAEAVETRNGAVRGASLETSAGIGIRVLGRDGWSFAGTWDTSERGVGAALRRAMLAAGSARPVAPVGLPAPQRAVYRTPFAEDPFAVSLEAKLDLLLAIEARLREEARVGVTSSAFGAVRERRVLASTAGSWIDQESVECGVGCAATAVAAGDAQTRSAPLDVAQAGWEHVRGTDLAARAPQLAAEAVELLAARPCPAGRATVVLGGAQLALQVHESVGHAVELDRVLGLEAAYAGTSFVAPDDAGRLRYGSPAMRITADATLAGGLGSYAFDDEGVAAQRVPIVDEGTLVGFLSSSQSAAEAGLASSGASMRADGWSRQAMVRMTNVNLEPGGAGSLDDLLADTGSGIYLETPRGYSIDDRRLSFHFAPELAREIRGGRLGRAFRNPTYSGVTPEFWGSLDAVCGQDAWRLWGLVQCGKGEPAQLARVSHGTAPARFRNVLVGTTA